MMMMIPTAIFTSFFTAIKFALPPAKIPKSTYETQPIHTPSSRPQSTHRHRLHPCIPLQKDINAETRLAVIVLAEGEIGVYFKNYVGRSFRAVLTL
jgi:hypothetical protein